VFLCQVILQYNLIRLFLNHHLFEIISYLKFGVFLVLMGSVHKLLFLRLPTNINGKGLKETQMKLKFLNTLLVSSMLLVALLSNIANASLMEESVFLDINEANLLQSWLQPLGADLEWKNFYYGDEDASISQWNIAKDSHDGAKVFLYDITYNNVNMILGAYTSYNYGSYTQVWDSSVNQDTFIFNLTNNDKRDFNESKGNEIQTRGGFGQFGGGLDLSAGFGSTLGNGNLGKSYNNGLSYGDGATNLVTEKSESSFIFFSINQMSAVYVTEKVHVPEPSTLAIFALGVIALASRQFKK